MDILSGKKKERKRRWDDVRREEGREREQPKERRREGRGYGVAEEDFQCSCMYNKWGGTLFETPARRFTSRFAGQSEALWSHTSHPFYPANRCFHLALWFDPVEKQITFSVWERGRKRERERPLTMEQKVGWEGWGEGDRGKRWVCLTTTVQWRPDDTEENTGTQPTLPK